MKSTWKGCRVAIHQSFMWRTNNRLRFDKEKLNFIENWQNTKGCYKRIFTFTFWVQDRGLVARVVELQPTPSMFIWRSYLTDYDSSKKNSISFKTDKIQRIVKDEFYLLILSPNRGLFESVPEQFPIYRKVSPSTNR